MAGVDDAGRRTRQINPHEQTSYELAPASLLGQRVTRQPRLLGQLNAPPTSVAQTPDQHSGQQSGIHRVAHGVGH